MQHYSYKEKEYYIQEKLKLKHPISRQWLDAIVYVQIGSGLKFCREVEEFYRLFKRE